jgi:hypothetical protein
MRRIMTSRAYQLEAAQEKATEKQYTFRGPRLRRLSAEQFEDAISAVTGDWRVLSPRADTHSSYTREWRLKSDPLSRVLGRPIRDQVYTERSSEATTLQALELTNGPLLSKRLERGAKALLGQLEPAPANRFDSKLMRAGKSPVDVDITGAKELWLLVEDVDSYDRARVIAGWANPELEGPAGTMKLDMREPGIPSSLKWDIAGKGFTRFRAQAFVDERSRQSDINPAVRFFVFTEKPNPDQLMRLRGEAPYQPPQKKWTAAELVDRLYAHLLARNPTSAERKTAQMMVGGTQPSTSGVEDLLWALLMSPEFQYIH